MKCKGEHIIMATISTMITPGRETRVKLNKLLSVEWQEIQKIIRYFTKQGFILSRELLSRGWFKKPIPIYYLDYANRLVEIYIDYIHYKVILKTGQELEDFREELKIDNTTLDKLIDLIESRVALKQD